MAQIPLLNGGFALVDDEDLPLVSCRTWRLQLTTKRKRPQSIVSGSGSDVVSMHRLIVPAEPGMVVDHINRDPMDNRRINLRLCTRSENSRNRKVASHNKSGFKGVYLDRSRRAKRWRAEIKVNGRKISLGTFPSPEAAAAAYDLASTIYHRSYGVTNRQLRAA